MIEQGGVLSRRQSLPATRIISLERWQDISDSPIKQGRILDLSRCTPQLQPKTGPVTPHQPLDMKAKPARPGKHPYPYIGESLRDYPATLLIQEKTNHPGLCACSIHNRSPCRTVTRAALKQEPGLQHGSDRD